MTEEQANAIADSLGGESWQSGGGIWLVLKHRKNGAIVVISDEAVCEYSTEYEFDACRPNATILLV